MGKQMEKCSSGPFKAGRDGMFSQQHRSRNLSLRSRRFIQAAAQDHSEVILWMSEELQERFDDTAPFQIASFTFTSTMFLQEARCMSYHSLRKGLLCFEEGYTTPRFHANSVN